jgi:uncharacterized membrane protein YdbT with pleckstrin-like domain
VAQILSDLYEELRNPDLIVASYLSSQEEVYYDDPPAIQSFLFLNWWEIGLVAGLLAADIFFLLSFGPGVPFLATFLAADALVIVLVVQRFQQLFTRYVITSSRIMRVSGVLSRRSVSIPWAKVTDISFGQTLWTRYLGFANVRIESANEASGLQELRGLKNPLQFHRLMLEMVASKQGHTSPESGDAPLAKFEADSPLRQRARRMSNQPRLPTGRHGDRRRTRRRRHDGR